MRCEPTSDAIRQKLMAAQVCNYIQDIDLNVSQVAVTYDHHPLVFQEYLRKHEPKLIEQLGLNPVIRNNES